MSGAAVQPAVPGDVRYVFGVECTWHDAIRAAGRTRDGTPVCPHCGGALYNLLTETEFWNGVAAMTRTSPGYDEMMRWSRGRCFPDFDTQENAWRQAMEGQS